MSDLIERLRKTARWCACGGLDVEVCNKAVNALEAKDAEIEQLRAALEAVRGFCKYCGATYPHRYGEGRCGHCAALDGEQDQDNE